MSDNLKELETNLDQAATIDEVTHILNDLAKSQQTGSGGLSTRDLLQCYNTACNSLRRMTSEKPNAVQSLVAEFFINPCVEEVESEASVAQYQLREHVVKWIEQYAEPDYVLLRNALVDKVLQHLERNATRSACWLLSEIGYRSQQVVSRLWQIVKQHDNPTGDAALATLVTIGSEHNDHARILSEAHRRAEKQPNNSLAHIISYLGTLESLNLLVKHWINSEDTDFVDSSRLMHVFQSILKRNVDDADLQDLIWHQLQDLTNAYPKLLQGHFYLGNIGSSCNSPLVISTLLEWLEAESGEEEKIGWNSYLIGKRLEESVRPRQVEGWSHLTVIPALRILQKYACSNTAWDGVASTEAKNVKQKCWETLLRAGHQDVLDWFDIAVGQETGRFVQQYVMELLACFRVDPLPKQIKEWIVERTNLSRGQVDGRLMAHSEGAIRMARSNATRDAFEALLQIGVTIEDDGLRSSGIALAEVALCLYDQEPDFVLERLVNTLVTKENPGHYRDAAGFALERVVAKHKVLRALDIEGLILVASDQSRPLYERGNALSTLAYVENWEIEEETLSQFIDWAKNPDTWLGGGAMEILTRRGYLASHSALLQSVLGLTLVNGKWDLASENLRVDWAGYFIGQLYYQDPERFLSAIISSVKMIDGRPLTQMMTWIRTLHTDSQSPLPSSLSQALVDRIHAKQSRMYGETEILYLLGEFSIERLVEEPWNDIWNNWLPNIRSVLADVIYINQSKLNSQGGALILLHGLTQDTYYAVRRAAYRAIARLSPDALASLASAWSQADSIEDRKRAAEACIWMSDENQERDILATLDLDPEKQVRVVAQRAREEWYQKRWAQEYLERIQSITDFSNNVIFANWPYGDALSRTGNDDTIFALEKHIENESLPPHARYWLARILRGVRKHWEETAQNWPEPWVSFQGILERGYGKLISAKDQGEQEIQYSLWQHLAPIPTEVSSWGGILWTEGPWLVGTDRATLVLNDGRRGEIAASKTVNNVMIFQGDSSYPGSE